MKVTTEECPQQEAQLNIELEPDDVEKYLERAYRQTVKRLNVPGFRKGKAPRRVIEQMYGREYLLNEALDFMVPEATSQAVQDASLEVAGVPSIKIDQLDPPSFTATVPLPPKVDLGNYLELRLPKERVKVSKQQIDAIVEQLQLDMALWEPVDELVAFEDLVNVTIHGWVVGEQLMNSENVDYVPREHSRAPVPGFAESVIGMARDQGKEFTIDVPEDVDNPQVAGKSCRFEVTVHEVKRKKLPVLDDEFAEGVGEGYESLKALRKSVEDDLTRQEERASEARYQEQMLDAVIRNATIEFSPLLVDHEVEHQLEDHAEAIRTGRVSFEQYQQQLEWAGKSVEEVREASRPTAEVRIKRGLLIGELISRHGIEASDQEVKDELERVAASAGQQADAARKMFGSEQGKASLERTVANRKAMQMFTSIAQGDGPNWASSSGDESDEPKENETKAAGGGSDA